MARKRYLIVGDGAAGISAAERLRALDATASVGLFTEDPHPAYFRAALTNYLLGELREDQLWAVTPDFYDTQHIHRIHSRVVGIDSARRLLWDSTGNAGIPYDQLLIASGARPRLPEFAGASLHGVLTLRTIQDVRRIVEVISSGNVRNAVIAGGGALGLEWAHGLLEHGVQVTLLERAPRLLHRVLDEVASDLLAARLRKARVALHLGDQVQHCLASASGTLAGIRTAAGQELPCQLLGAALGVVPNTEFLRGSGVTLNEQGAVVVNAELQTSVAGIWAAGDVANVAGQQLQLWEPARHQGRLAAEGMCGKPTPYQPGAHYFATRLFDLDFATVGSLAAGPNVEFLTDFPRGTGTIAYRKLALSAGRLVGALLVGERAAAVRSSGRAYKKLIDLQVPVSAIRERLLDKSFDFRAWLETQKCLEAPRASAAPHAASSRGTVAARLRGTQVFSLSALSTGATPGPSSQPASAPGTERAAVPAAELAAIQAAAVGLTARSSDASARSAAPRQTRLLSIGLPAEAPLPAPQPSGARDSGLWLECLGVRFALNQPLTNLGTDKSCHIVLNDPRASALHAQITRHGQAFYLRDAGSESGTRVNERFVTEPCLLSAGQRLQLGSTLLSVAGGPPADAALTPGHAFPRLEVLAGKNCGLGFRLQSERVLLGRGADCQIQLEDLSVETRHASIALKGSTHCVSDLGSTYGSYVNRQRLLQGQEIALSEGSVLTLGRVSLLYTCSSTVTSADALALVGILQIVSGPASGKQLRVAGGASIGSSAQASLCVPGLVPEHFRVVASAGQFWGHDLSGGRSFRNGQPLSSAGTALQHGDLLLLGEQTLLRFEEAL